jgi:putative PIN family toxin of toxin-antitoxin system
MTIKLVLDTNIVLDWLVFDNAFMNPLRDGVREQRVIVVTHPHVIEELQRVLAYRALKLDSSHQSQVLAHYCAQTHTTDLLQGYSPENLMLPTGFPECRDRDDQHFLALTYHTKADALVSRDKAVLKLRKRAQKFGVRILDVTQMMAMLS